jgi:uncharacterized membrane protein
MTVTGSVMRRTLTIAAACVALACSSDLPTEVADVDIRAAKGGSTGGSTKPTGGLTVGAALPREATQDTTLDVRILGSGFSRGMVARWAIDSVVTSKVVVNSTRYVSSTELVANITVTSDAPLTEYDIIVTSTKGGKPGIGTEVFEVVQELGLASLGGTSSAALDINESGQIAGYSTYYVPGGFVGNEHPVIWESDGTIRDLLPSGYAGGRAVAINESGQVAGWLWGETGMTPFTWSPGTGMRFLPTLPGETQNGVYAMNDAGVVAGWSGRSAVIWENGILRVVHHDPAQWSTATDINNLGEVVGFYEPTYNGTPHTAWKWSAASAFQLLPTLQGNTGSPMAINDRGQIVGSGPSATGGSPAFIHENGVTRQLSAGGITVSNATAISEAGHIAGWAADGRSVLWLPDGTPNVICIPVPPANGYTSWCAAYAVNAEGIAVGMKTDKYGRGTKAYKWSLDGF